MASEKVTQLIEDVKALTVLELSELVKALEEEFGVSAAAPMAVAAGPAAGAADGPAEEEQTEFTVTLTDVGPNKMNVIKVVREITGSALMEAKAIVDSAPKAIKENVSKEDADEIVAKLKEAGADVEVK